MIASSWGWSWDFTFGKTNVGGSEDWWFSGRVVATNFTCSESGTLTRISAYIKCASSSNVKVGIWRDLDKSKLAESNAVSVGTSFSWVNFSVGASVSLENYWLGFVSESESIYFKYDSGSERTCVDFEGSFTLPDALDTSAVYNQIVSIYATYTILNEDRHVQNIDTGLNYTTIQEAINANETLNGHTIFAKQGTYYEHVIVNKSLSIIGENRSTTVIDGGYTGNVVEISASNVTLEGFTIQNSASYAYGGIFISEGNTGNNISYNTLRNNGAGIRFDHAEKNLVFGNVVSNNYYGIHVDFNGFTTISNNFISSNNRDGIVLFYSSGNVIASNHILSNAHVGIYLWYSGNNSVSNNTVTDNLYNSMVDGDDFSDFNNDVDESNMVDGRPVYYLKSISDIVYDSETNVGAFYLVNCKNITIQALTLSKNGQAIFMWNTTNSGINNVTCLKNAYGIYLDQSSGNMFFHNNFINNTEQAWIYNSTNLWDNGAEGNYWSNYSGVDSDPDGIGDLPQVLDVNNQDNYPLMGVFNSLTATPEYDVQTVCNSTISDFQFDGTAISFNVTSEDGTAGFCRIRIPTALMNGTHRVFVNEIEVSYDLLPVSNSSYSYIYFTYDHSTKEVIIIPEFPSFIIMLIFMMPTLLVTIIYRRRISIAREH